MKIHEERNWKSLFLKYELHDDRIKIRSILPFYSFEIPYSEIEKVEIGTPPVIWDMIKKGYFTKRYGFGLRVLKNDLADLFRHVTIEKNSGYWRQIRITPKDPDEFLMILKGRTQGRGNIARQT